MALSMYLHMLCRSAINTLIWRFSKHYFCEKNGKIDFSDKICTACVQKRQQFFFAGNFAEQTSQTYLPRVQAKRKIALKKYRKPCPALQNFESPDPGLCRVRSSGSTGTQRSQFFLSSIGSGV